MSMHKLTAAFTLVLGLGLGTAAAASPGNLYVFGDSLSDNGNLYAATGGAVPTPNYPGNGGATNGPVWVDYFAAAHPGIAVSDRAIVGAYSGLYNTPGFGVSDNSLDSTLNAVPVVGSLLATAAYGLGTEVLTAPVVTGTNAAAVLWIGANDILSAQDNGFATPADVVPTALSNVNVVLGYMRTTLGFADVYIANLPDIGRTPRANVLGLQNEYSQAVNDFNLGLSNIVSGGGAGIHLVDVYTAFNFVLANPAAFGITNTTDGCISGATDPNLCSDLGAQRVYWDDVHPTTLVHGIIAGAFQNAIVPVPVPAAFPLLGSALLLLLRIKRAA
ncbi:MAG: SGNH/GDSL hydrolase family protein [Gammaproteobacteria bacterium]|nr:SGNH/GDSL hydrolase family protein [Gammaproteobacteria bacterium]MBI5616621.1 SGNH/GDSL hydrolase family protein [Gammaproteobacteria bacterium]